MKVEKQVFKGFAKPLQRAEDFWFKVCLRRP